MVIEGDPVVGAALARDSRLSDSGALELRRMLIEETGGEYEDIEEIGRGGMAIVFKANEVHLSRVVAVKVLPPELTFTKGATERFRREAKTAAALDHPNIIPIYRVSASGRLFWYAMKFLEGRTLLDILDERGCLSAAEAIAILEKVADALDYAHQRSVVHRDIKPGNVMLDASGRIIVTDFGIAKELSGSGLTGSGAIIGTPYYMSPEQCRGGQLTGAADQYSLGVMTYQMVSGHLPFDAESAIDVIHKHVHEPAPPLEALVPGLPLNVVNAINRAMSKKPADRFPSVTAFVSALRNAPSDATLIMHRRHTPQGRQAGVPRRTSFTRMVTVVGSAKRVVLLLAVMGAVVIGAIALTLKFVIGGAGQPGVANEQPVVGQPPVPAAGSAATGSDSTVGRAPGDTAGATQVAGDTGAARGSLAAGTDTVTARDSGVTPAPRTRPRTATGGSRTGAAAGKGWVVLQPSVWANIEIAGRTISQRSVWGDSLPAGRYTAVLSRDGYQTVRVTVRVRAGRETVVRIPMVLRSGP